MAGKTRIRDIEVDIINEEDGSFAIACSALGVYAAGNTMNEAKEDFLQALDLHLEELRADAVRSLSAKSFSAKAKSRGSAPWASSA